MTIKDEDKGLDDILNTLMILKARAKKCVRADYL